MKPNFKLFFSAVLIIAIAGCSPSAPKSSTTPANKVIIRGSNTVGEELAPKLVAAYKKDHSSEQFDLEFKGTSYGFGALVGGFCDIAGASRMPNKNELEVAKFRNVELNDHVIGYYSVAVVVNAGNPLTNLTKEQVHDFFTGTVTNWSAIGGPDKPVHLYVRDPSSGTYLGFKELAMDNAAYGLEQNLFTNYEGIVKAVANDADGVGYSSFELENQPGVKPVSIGGIKPENASVISRAYPYARKLHLFTAKGNERAEALDFIQYVLSPAGQSVLAKAGNTPIQ